VSTTFTNEIHPFLADLPIFESEVESIAESIQEVGLLHPITLDTEGRVIGGRHRLAACERANVEPEFEVYEDDPLAFMLHDNATRKHQTTSQIAAENALTLEAAERRNNGRWKRNSVPDDMRNVSHNAWRKALEKCGLILDHLGREALQVIARGDADLHETFQQAEQRRDAERQKLEQQKRLEAEEADARAFIEENDPELASQVGDVFQSYVEAHDVWKRRNREEAERIRREQAAKERAERERKASLTEMYSNGIGRALMTLGSYGQRDNPADVMSEFSVDLLDPPQLQKQYSADNIRAAQRFLESLLEWSSK